MSDAPMKMSTAPKVGTWNSKGANQLDASSAGMFARNEKVTLLSPTRKKGGGADGISLKLRGPLTGMNNVSLFCHLVHVSEAWHTANSWTTSNKIQLQYGHLEVCHEIQLTLAHPDHIGYADVDHMCAS